MLFQGKEVSIVVKQSERRYAMMQGDCIFIFSPDTSQADKILYQWLKDRCSLMIKQSVWRISRQMNIEPSAIQIRDQRTRWGSCSSRGVLSFNFRIAFAPREVMDYVVVHELAHLVERNHSKRFWSLVAKNCNGYKEKRAWLRRNGRSLTIPAFQ
ncbi:MAG: M48 family metallopeptidase [Conexivisphaerales archaeon]